MATGIAVLFLRYAGKRSSSAFVSRAARYGRVTADKSMYTTVVIDIYSRGERGDGERGDGRVRNMWRGRGWKGYERGMMRREISVGGYGGFVGKKGREGEGGMRKNRGEEGKEEIGR